MKARARAARWREEILLLGEEMRRAIMFCETEAFEWLMRARYIMTSPNVTEDERDGLLAYANERISQERALANAWTTKWDVVRRRTAAIKKEMMSPPRPHPEELDDILGDPPSRVQEEDSIQDWDSDEEEADFGPDEIVTLVLEDIPEENEDDL